MKTRNLNSIALFLALPILVQAGCRTDPGTPDYLSQERFDFGVDMTADGPTEPDVPSALLGPDPWEPGEDRLAFGLFYEGGASDVLPINDVTSFFFLFELTPGGALSAGLQSTTDRIEGLSSNEVVHTGGGFWGLTIAWLTEPPPAGTPRGENLSAWTTMHISLKSSDDAFVDVAISMSDAGGDNTVSAADYGYANDGQWHTLTIPTSDFVDAGLSLSAVTQPIALTGGAGDAGETLLVDNFYLTSP